MNFLGEKLRSTLAAIVGLWSAEVEGRMADLRVTEDMQIVLPGSLGERFDRFRFSCRAILMDLKRQRKKETNIKKLCSQK